MYFNKFCFLILILSFSFTKVLFAQDARVSQYHGIPLLINPAQTGDFTGRVRLLGLFAKVGDQTSTNTIYNTSLDLRVGRKKNWGMGFNYMESGASDFPLSGKYTATSLAKGFFIDKYKFQELRLGAQMAYLQGYVDESRGPYNKLLDVRAFRYFQPASSNGLYKGEASYFNYSAGLKYNLSLERLKIETGFSAYNITNPGYDIMYNGNLRKRFRVTALSSIYYRTDPKNAIKFEHFSWKEGIYLREYIPSRDLNTEIHETIYSLTWHRYFSRNNFSVGAFTRSFKSAYVIMGLNLNDRIGLSVSYEMPILNVYYDVNHVEFSISIIPFGQKKKTGQVRQKELENKVKAVLPFGERICLPCIGTLPFNKIDMPDSLKSAKPISNKDSIPSDTDIKYLKPDSIKSTIVISPSLDVPKKVAHNNNLETYFFKDTIYYDFDKFNIRPDASVKLNQIAKFMNTYKSLTLHIRSHTDLRGSVVYNETLSKNRSNSVIDYLVKLGIDKDRISSSWYSETTPLSDCEACNDLLQQKNRRSELNLKGFNSYNLAKYVFDAQNITQEQLNMRIKIFKELHVNTGLSTIDNDENYNTIQLDVVNALSPEDFSILKALNMSLFERLVDGQTLYFFGKFSNKRNAEEVLMILKEIGFKNAFVRTGK